MGQSIKIQAIDVKSYQIPLIRPFTFAGTTVSVRTGYYVHMVSDAGVLVISEAAPLPGISQESLKKSNHDLNTGIIALTGRDIPLEKKELLMFLRNDELFLSLCPSARFALESACVLLAAKTSQMDLSEYLGGQKRPITSAVLLQGPLQEVLDEARKEYDKGARVFKLKVGDRNIPLDVKKVSELRAQLGKDITLRLDANRVWSYEEAILFAQLTGTVQIEFIEEPLSDASRLSEFYQATHMPIALDETLILSKPMVTTPGRCMPPLSQREGVHAYILKPMIIGSLVLCLDWIDEARRYGKKAIISSSFESSIGLNILTELACLTDTVAGLGTARWMSQ